MKNKGKKTYLTFMALFLAVTMLISSSITLAFFGASAGGSTTIKMGNAVTVGVPTIVESEPLYVSPSEMVDIDATATVRSPGNENSTTDAILRAKITSTFSSANIAVVPTTTFNSTTAYWVKGSDGYHYLVETLNGDICKTIDTTTTGVDIPMQISVIIPRNLNNNNGGAEYKVQVVFCAIQATIYDDTGLTPITNSIKNTKPIFDQVEGVGKVAKSIQRIEGNSAQLSTPSPYSPVEVKSVGEVTDNLFLFDNIKNTGATANMVNYSNDTLSLTSSENLSVIGESFTTSPEAYNKFNSVLNLTDAEYYCMSCNVNSDNDNIEVRSNWAINVISDESFTITPVSTNFLDGKLFFKFYISDSQINSIKSSNTFRLYVYHFRDKTTLSNVDVTISNIMFIKGDYTSLTMPEYEPNGYKIPVNVGNETYNIYLDEPLRKVGEYADYIDFTTGKIVRRVKASQIDENTSIGKFASVTDYSAFYIDFSKDLMTYNQHGKVNLQVMSEQLKYYTCGGANANTSWSGDYQIGGSLASTYTRICFTLPNTITDVASAQTWLADNPISVYYPLATPISTNIDLSHIPQGVDAIYSITTNVLPTVIYGE